MNGFFQSMVTRHLGNENKILPRLREKFEPFTNAPMKQDNGFIEQSTEPESKLNFQDSNLNQSPASSLFPSQPDPAGQYDSTDKNDSSEFRNRSANLPAEFNPDHLNRKRGIDPEKLSDTEEKKINVKADSLLFADLDRNLDPNDISTTAALPDKREINSGSEYEKQGFSAENEMDNQADAGRKFPNARTRDDLSWLQEFRKTYDGIKSEENTKTESQSIVRVNIGRIDVRALTKQSTPQPEPVQKKPGISLEEFLNKKSGLKT